MNVQGAKKHDSWRRAAQAVRSHKRTQLALAFLAGTAVGGILIGGLPIMHYHGGSFENCVLSIAPQARSSRAADYVWDACEKKYQR